MKLFIEVFCFILIVGTIFVILGLKHFDEPVMNCSQYIELNNLEAEVCGE